MTMSRTVTKEEVSWFQEKFNFSRRANWQSNFYDFDIKRLEKLLATAGEKLWSRLGERNALRLFRSAARRVPAYRQFLASHKIDPEKIRTTVDFALVPATDKKNYTNQFTLAERCWDGKLVPGASIAAVSSGTSGEPKYWPRGSFQEYEAAVIHELLYRRLFQIDRFKTLLVIGFPMGIYVSGLATVLPSFAALSGRYDVTIISVGNNKREALRAISNLASDFEQIVLVGHPFFVKDIIESGDEEKIDWASRRLKLMFCSEGFNETWRHYLSEKAGLPIGVSDIFNTYGSSEMLLMGYETPFTVLLRNVLEQNSEARHKLLGDSSVVPSIFQYNPAWRYIETNAKSSDLLFTVASGLPMIRYNLKDSGCLVGWEVASELLDSASPEWARTAGGGTKKVGGIWKLPLVGLYGRSDQTLVFYAANIYPEHIRQALQHPSLIDKLTGRFTMRKDYLPNMDQFLEINVELAPNVHESETKIQSVETRVIETLKQINMEYLFLTKNLDKDLDPVVRLWPYQHEKYFKPGLKPKYILEENKRGK